jgi:hypothetical protein
MGTTVTWERLIADEHAGEDERVQEERSVGGMLSRHVSRSDVFP